jgi:hypothetical protein
MKFPGSVYPLPQRGANYEDAVASLEFSGFTSISQLQAAFLNFTQF